MYKKLGICCLIVGMLCLAAAIFAAFAFGTIAVPILTLASILLNSLGIMLLRR